MRRPRGWGRAALAGKAPRREPGTRSGRGSECGRPGPSLGQLFSEKQGEAPGRGGGLTLEAAACGWRSHLGSEPNRSAPCLCSGSERPSSSVPSSWRGAATEPEQGTRDPLRKAEGTPKPSPQAARIPQDPGELAPGPRGLAWAFGRWGRGGTEEHRARGWLPPPCPVPLSLGHPAGPGPRVGPLELW